MTQRRLHSHHQNRVRSAREPDRGLPLRGIECVHLVDDRTRYRNLLHGHLHLPTSLLISEREISGRLLPIQHEIWPYENCYPWLSHSW